MRSTWLFILLGTLLLSHSLSTASGEKHPPEKEESGPTLAQCKPYVDKALKGEIQEEGGVQEATSSASEEESQTEDSGASEEASNEEGASQEDASEAPEDASASQEASQEASEESEPEAASEESPSEEKSGGEESGEEAEPEPEVASEESASEEEGQGGTVEENAEGAPSAEEQQQDAESVHDGPGGESEEDPPAEDQRDGSNPDPVAESSDEPLPQASQEASTEGQEGQDASKESGSKAEEEPVASESNESNPGNSEESPAAPEPPPPEPINYVPRSRDELESILRLEGSKETLDLATLLEKTTQTTLKELKGIYEHSIKPLETMYKYRDLSNRHFGDPEIFSKPMVLFMGPWSGGKSSIINWLLGIEHEAGALRVGADPSPAQFNIMIHGDEDEDLDGTQLAADWTFSGLQKFGQSFLDRLHGRRMPKRLLEKVNLVEIPGILEVRKQVERSFPFNDACQWFIDRADILFLVYDPAKLDIGPETEAILDQLKGRENQVRIVLNKADSVKPDELLRVQATLVWNISPHMASAEPPIMYAASLWGRPLNPESPVSLLNAHENHFLTDIRDSVDKRVETRIAAARRFAVRVRNHGKMVDCYLNTFYNHRSFFSDKKKISTDIIDHPQNYHIYEGLSTLTNISRYDLPDPDTYRDFFKLNPLWEFPTLSSTCTYFKGCPINKLDIAIAYELPELLGRFRRSRESILSAQVQQEESPPPPPPTSKWGKKKGKK